MHRLCMRVRCFRASVHSWCDKSYGIESTDHMVPHHNHTDAKSHGKGKHHGPTCLPRFPGLPIGPLCPGTPDCPFGPISPLVGAERRKQEIKYRNLCCLVYTSLTL